MLKCCTSDYLRCAFERSRATLRVTMITSVNDRGNALYDAEALERKPCDPEHEKRLRLCET